MNLYYSFIIPVFNRPKELDDLLSSILNQSYTDDFEIVVVEDGSTQKADLIIEKFTKILDIVYYYKPNSGAGDSRNFGMERASGTYFIILDSDVILPQNYLIEVDKRLKSKYSDAFGGPDKAKKTFSAVQKGINYAMTSFFTTGGLRNKNNAIGKYQLRSFNMGLSKKAFQITNGFTKQHFGEDIELTHRLWQNGLSTQLIENAYVYHKRRANSKRFFNQTFNFGAARPILMSQFETTTKLTYFFPTLFFIGLIVALIALYFNNTLFLFLYGFYAAIIFIDASYKNKSFKVGCLSLWMTLIQFLGYGLGFLRSYVRIKFLKKTQKETFPKMFS